MKNLIQAAVVTLLVASMSQAQQAVRWKVSDGGNGHWYQAVSVDHPVSWDAARDACVALGGHLAMIATEADGAMLRNAVQSADWGQFGP